MLTFAQRCRKSMMENMLRRKTRGLLLAAATVTALSLTSCFKDEALNNECDIEQAYLSTEDYTEVFYSASDSMIYVLSNEDEITFRVKDSVDLTALAPEFIITEGATISPESGSVHDFSGDGVTYTVTSEDGAWSRQYLVSFMVRQRTIDEIDGFSFERFYLETDKNKYYVWNDTTDDGYDLDNWSTGNPGYAISSSTAEPDEYPTVPLEEGYEGYGVKLTTLSTGALGKLASRPIAAGNLFLGKFDVTKALSNSMESTMFGVPVTKKPLKMSGYFKYSRGDTFTNIDSEVLEDSTDYANIYASFYINTDADGNQFYLHGDDAKTSEQIVALANNGQLDEADEWTYFEIEFNYYSDVDEDLLANYGYSLAVICTSSSHGSLFEGAVGSTLCVDELKITWEE